MLSSAIVVSVFLWYLELPNPKSQLQTQNQQWPMQTCLLSDHPPSNSSSTKFLALKSPFYLKCLWRFIFSWTAFPDTNRKCNARPCNCHLINNTEGMFQHAEDAETEREQVLDDITEPDCIIFSLLFMWRKLKYICISQGSQVFSYF